MRRLDLYLNQQKRSNGLFGTFALGAQSLNLMGSRPAASNWDFSPSQDMKNLRDDYLSVSKDMSKSFSNATNRQK